MVKSGFIRARSCLETNVCSLRFDPCIRGVPLLNEFAADMESLKKVIKDLRREISSALSDKTPLPSGVQLIANRVTVCLRVSIGVEKVGKTKGKLSFGV
jgi:hypothetical protein